MKFSNVCFVFTSCFISVIISSKTASNAKTIVKTTNNTQTNDIFGYETPAQLINDGVKATNRLLWMSKQRKFVLPRGTILTLSPKITLPVFRNKPFEGGLNSDIQATWFFYMYFDKLGMTSEDHIWPLRMPPFYPFTDHMGPFRKEDKDKDMNMDHDRSEEERRINAVRTAAMLLSKIARSKRKNRSVLSLPPPENIHGGERATMIGKIENLLSSLGMEGRPCLLRAVCEVHEFPLEKGYGFFGELVTLFFSISKSEYADSHMPEYLKAEMMGRSGECSSYFKNCTKSIFHWEEKSKYAPEMQNVIPDSRYF